MCLLYVGYGEYNPGKVANYFSGEGCHGVLFPVHVTINVSSMTGDQQPLLSKVFSKILKNYP